MNTIPSILLLSMLSLAAAGPSEYKWAWEDHNGDGAWNYSIANWNFESSNEWTNLPLSSDAFEGSSSIVLHYLNEDLHQGGGYTQAFGFVKIPTSWNAGAGMEPTYYDEFWGGKDLMAYDAVSFYIKGTGGANQSAFSVSLQGPSGHSSAPVYLADWVQITQEWQRVEIPMAQFMPAFNNFDRFQLWNVNNIIFYVDQDDANVPFTCWVDNISILDYPEVPEFKWAHEEVSSRSALNMNGAWNYSWSRWDASASLTPANQWNDIKTSLTEAYEGRSSIEIDFAHFAGGYIDLYLSTHPNGQGHEPASFAEKDAPKDISAYNTFRFFIKKANWQGGAPQLSFDLIETPFRNANPVLLSNYIQDWSFNDWVEVRIPLADMKAGTSDFSRIKEIWIRFNHDFPAQAGKIYLDNIGFIKVTEQGAAMDSVRSWWVRDANENGEYNYSTSRTQNGTTLNVANQWNDLVAGAFYTGPYGGYEVEAVDLKFGHNGYGYAEANFTTSVISEGEEPVSFSDRDFGKSISNSNTLMVFSGQFSGEGLRVRLVDMRGNQSRSVLVDAYRNTYGRYMWTWHIPTYVFEQSGFAFHEVQFVRFFVDGRTEAGNFDLMVANLRFQRIEP